MGTGLFYSEALQRCESCGKAAEISVYRIGKIAFGVYCSKCGAARLLELNEEAIDDDA